MIISQEHLWPTPCKCNRQSKAMGIGRPTPKTFLNLKNSMNHIISSSVPATLHALVQLQNQPLTMALSRKAKKSHSVFPLVFITSCLVFYSIVLGSLLTWHFICTFYSKQGRRKSCLQPFAFKRLVSQKSSCILF